MLLFSQAEKRLSGFCSFKPAKTERRQQGNNKPTKQRVYAQQPCFPLAVLLSLLCLLAFCRSMLLLLLLSFLLVLIGAQRALFSLMILFSLMVLFGLVPVFRDNDLGVSCRFFSFHFLPYVFVCLWYRSCDFFIFFFRSPFYKEQGVGCVLCFLII
eukprot:m.125317 g.125317  ORF g.125317 m.125317 type:complete len:156 (+) comp16649_c2_seq1:1253-1720(+)